MREEQHFGETPNGEEKREINTLEDVNGFNDLYELLDKKQPDEKIRGKIKGIIKKAQEIVDMFIAKKDKLPKFEKFLEDQKSPLVLLKKELRHKVVEVLKKEAKENQEIVEHNLIMLKKEMVKILNKESMGARGTIKVDGENYFLMAVNGLVDPKAGKLIAFGNNIHEAGVDQETYDNASGIQVRIAAHKKGYKIVGITDEHQFNERALKNIQRAFEKYDAILESR